MLLPQEHTVMVRQTARWGQILLISLVGLGATAFTTACLYEIDEVITVQGKLVPQEGGVEVKSPTEGQFQKIFVSNGDQVKDGQNLFRYDVKEAKLRKATLLSQIEIEEEKIKDLTKMFNKRQETITRNIRLTEKILGKLKPIAEDGAISEIQILQQENNLEGLRDEKDQITNQKRDSVNSG